MNYRYKLSTLGDVPENKLICCGEWSEGEALGYLVALNLKMVSHDTICWLPKEAYPYAGKSRLVIVDMGHELSYDSAKA